MTPLAMWMWRYTLGNASDTKLSEQVFTDWDEVDRFADAFLVRVHERADVVRTAAGAA